MAVSRADRRTERAVQPVYWADFDINLSKNPVTGELARLTNAEAVKSSVRNIVLTVCGERRFRPLLGSKLLSSLFELGGDEISASVARETIFNAIHNFEPRARLVSVDVNEALFSGDFGLVAVVTFGLQSQLENVTVTVPLRRVR